MLKYKMHARVGGGYVIGNCTFFDKFWVGKAGALSVFMPMILVTVFPKGNLKLLARATVLKIK